MSRRAYPAIFRRFPLHLSLIGILLWLGTARTIPAEEDNWLAAAYRVTVWYSLNEDAEIAATWQRDFETSLRDQLAITAGPEWDTTVAPMPPAVSRRMRGRPERPSPTELFAAAAETRSAA